MINSNVNKKNIFLILSVAFFITSLMLIIFASISINRYEQENLSIVKKDQQNLLTITSNSIDKHFGSLANSLDKYAQQLTDQAITPSQVGSILYKNLNRHNINSVLGASVIQLDSFGKIKKERLYWKFQNSQLVHINYNTAVKPEQNWFDASKTQTSHWSRPYYDKVLQQYVISYSSVYYSLNSHKIAGIVVIDLDLKSIIDLVAQNIGEKFTSIITDNGYYIYDINPDKIVSRTNIQKSTQMSDRQIYQYLQNAKCSTVCHNILNNGNDYVIYQHMSKLPWAIFSKYNQAELKSFILTTSNSAIMLQILGVVLLLISLVIFSLTLVTNRRNMLHNLWIGSGLISIICLVGTIYTWNKSQQLSYLDYQNSITSDVKLQSVLQHYRDEAKLKNSKEIIEIPTAIQVDSIEFLTAYNLQITGTIMQNYPKEYNISEGIKFNNSYDTKFTKISDINSAFYHTIVWTFQTKIRENFDYQHYPFNHAKIWLSLSPFNSESTLVFTPNFAYYNGLSDINANFGVNPSIIIPGWNIKGSFFDYVNDSSRMLDEIDAYDTVNLPSLSFNMIINSSISDAIITTIIPPTVIILILFVLLLTISKFKNKYIEFKVPGIISSCGGMLFTIVFTHVSLRNKITSEMMYIEYIYLVMYIVVLFIPINSMLFAYGKAKFIRYGNNIFIKLLFLPLLISFVFIMTLLSFC